MTPETYTDDEIRAVLDDVKTIAMVGASAKDVRPSYFVLKYLLAKGYHVIPKQILVSLKILFRFFHCRRRLTKGGTRFTNSALNICAI